MRKAKRLFPPNIWYIYKDATTTVSSLSFCRWFFLSFFPLFLFGLRRFCCWLVSLFFFWLYLLLSFAIVLAAVVVILLHHRRHEQHHLVHQYCYGCVYASVSVCVFASLASSVSLAHFGTLRIRHVARTWLSHSFSMFNQLCDVCKFASSTWFCCHLPLGCYSPLPPARTSATFRPVI